MLGVLAQQILAGQSYVDSYRSRKAGAFGPGSTPISAAESKPVRSWHALLTRWV